MVNKTSSFFCRVCGLDQGECPWGEDNNSPTFGICACCGAEFGYHDCTLIGIKKHREQWLQHNGKWFDNTARPLNWSQEEQMKNIPAEYL